MKVSFNVDKADDYFEVFTSHHLSISTAGTGSLSVANPVHPEGRGLHRRPVRTHEGQTDQRRRSEDSHQFTLNILHDDQASDEEHEHRRSGEISTYYSIPKAGEYTGRVYEYLGEYSNSWRLCRWVKYSVY